MIRELVIRALMKLHIAAYKVSRWAVAAHKAMVAGRSDEAVDRMERERGLR